MAKSGMRYESTKRMVSEINSIKQEMDKILSRFEARATEVNKVYGGEAAEDFTNKTVKVAQYLSAATEEIANTLANEAETQHDAYIAQEQRLKAGN